MPRPQPAPPPIPSARQIVAGVQLDTHFAAMTQGGIGLLRLRGADIVSARALSLGDSAPFFRADGGFCALLVADMDTHPRAYPLVVKAQLVAGGITFAREISVARGRFIVENLDMPGVANGLLDADVEADEQRALAAMTAHVGGQPLWDAAGFDLPLPSALTSPYGSYRSLNASARTRHTGWDQQAATGTPVRAMAAGRVAFAGQLAIRGGYVALDHGVGLYTGYAHFSALGVSAGQDVAAGQVIGLSGSSGRSSAPHLHWEVRLRGRWVDGLALLDAWLP